MKFVRIHRIVIVISVAFLAASYFCVSASAAEKIADGGIYQSYENLDDKLTDEARDALEKLGVKDPDFDSIFNISAGKAWELFKELVTGQTESPMKCLVRLLSVIILLAVCESFVPEGSGVKPVTEAVGVLFCVISIISPLSKSISSAVASISATESFMLTLIPTLAGVVTVSGNPTLALSFQTIAFTAAQVMSAVSKNYIVPVVGAVLSLDITGALMPSFRLNSLTSLIKKVITAVLSFGSTVFVSALGIKGALANAADTVASKSVKLVISSAVPVVGGAMSEAYSGVIGSLVLVKSTLGIFGIVAIALISLPSCVQLLFWSFSLRLSASVAELFHRQTIADLLTAISSAAVLLNVVLLFNTVLFIISTALILVIKAG
ncbi:MAG: hypothetical protein PUB20_07320 [Clostridia bacterium]|nr:hypothetical protein [Clostridia bacterium]